MLNKLLIATSNEGKIREIRDILSEESLTLVFLSDLKNLPPEPVESGKTFTENAVLKADAYASWSQLPSLADDSGLSVEALDGFPGVASARWKAGTDRDRVSGLLSMLEEKELNTPVERRAYFTSVLAISIPGEAKALLFEGLCYGTLAESPRGTDGFGYDSIFIPDGQNQTLAELGAAVKNGISARAKAFEQLATWLDQNTES